MTPRSAPQGGSAEMTEKEEDEAWMNAPMGRPVAEQTAVSLKSWLGHSSGCRGKGARPAYWQGNVKLDSPGVAIKALRGLKWRDGDEATCTCGLAQALGLKEGGR